MTQTTSSLAPQRGRKADRYNAPRPTRSLQLQDFDERRLVLIFDYSKQEGKDKTEYRVCVDLQKGCVSCNCPGSVHFSFNKQKRRAALYVSTFKGCRHARMASEFCANTLWVARDGEQGYKALDNLRARDVRRMIYEDLNADEALSWPTWDFEPARVTAQQTFQAYGVASVGGWA